ncbi:hypothetical protein ESA94_08675 [Lacibacter luteus]|uniref:Uncharacterized protein n=1 Tax=Lacibacter luteus TaxID=2508719 RepID=A0A4Q1CJ08_9BACT|nr:hypothetical protein [Lacibacter luteus]RXK60533.1 hypothetical protein ESA94_08675 [Lacibacter luteus]
MKFPEKIPIERIEDYHTHYLGKTSDGFQFWGYTTFVWTVLPKDIKGDWQDYRNEYVLLHLFDKEGNYIETKHWLGGSANQVNDMTLYSKLDTMVEELGEIEFSDIEIKMFQTTIDGERFGLIPHEESGFIELQPNSTIAFSEPWDGSYDT